MQPRDGAEPSDMDVVRGDAPGDAAELDQGGAGGAGECVYVLLDMDVLGEDGDLEPGSTLQLTGLDTFSPSVTLPDGRTCAARHDETVGTCMLFSTSQEPSPDTEVAYIAKTERLLKLQKPPPLLPGAPQPQGGPQQAAPPPPQPQQQQQQQQQQQPAASQAGMPQLP